MVHNMANAKRFIIYSLWFLSCINTVKLFNGDDVELECPDDCECHYFRINWVTDCSESDLTDIPYNELSQNVYILDMNGNNVSSIKHFPENIKMRRLQMAHNLLSEINKESFEGLEYLIDVDLSANKIKTIDSDTFEDCPGLLTLEVQDNLLGNVEGPFLVSRSLQYLDISSCQFEKLSTEFFVNLTSLHTVDLSKNPLASIGPGIFDPLTSLETFMLNGCRLREIHDNTFMHLESLKRLELAENVLTEVDLPLILGQLGKLEYLDLRNSRITYLPDETFSNTTWLRTLILADNELQYLELGDNLPLLDTLDLSNCHLRGFISKDAFSNSTKLKTLYLSGNHLQTMDLQIALEPLHSLEKLFLRNCSLEKLPDTFSKLKDLEELDISYNPLVDAFIDILSPLEKLEYLNMGYSNLSYIGADTFSKMTSMKRLVLSGNDLTSLEAGIFGNLKRLESLELNNCGLKKPINATVFFTNVTYKELTELKLAGNPMVISKEHSLLPKQFARIKILDLSNSNLTYLPDNAFRLNGNITELNLAGNNFTSEPGSLKFLQLLPNLQKLDLGNNNLTTIEPKIFVKNSKLQYLRLVVNPWKCGCNIAEMWDWAMMVKGDLSILVGSKTSPDDFTLKGAKQKKSLLCYYEDEQMKNFLNINRTVPGRRPFVKPPKEPTSANRTWAKYVRESGCEPVVRILKPLTLIMPEPSEVVNIAMVPSWSVAIIGVMIIVFAGILAALMGLRRARRANNLKKLLIQMPPMQQLNESALKH